jgi:hypothetical protein
MFDYSCNALPRSNRSCWKHHCQCSREHEFLVLQCTGMTAIPRTYHLLGILLATAMLMFVGYLTHISVLYIIRCPSFQPICIVPVRHAELGRWVGRADHWMTVLEALEALGTYTKMELPGCLTCTRHDKRSAPYKPPITCVKAAHRIAGRRCQL